MTEILGQCPSSRAELGRESLLQRPGGFVKDAFPELFVEGQALRSALLVACLPTANLQHPTPIGRLFQQSRVSIEDLLSTR